MDKMLPVEGKSRRVFHFLLMAAFCAFLALPFLDDLLNIDPTPNLIEKRELVPFPDFRLEWSSINLFPTRFDAFYKDHFGFRKLLITTYYLSHIKGLGSRFGDEVLIGKKGWFFGNAGGGMNDDWRAVTPLGPDMLEAWRKALTERQEWLAARGIHYIFVFAPDKHNFYAEFLPDSVRPSGRALPLDNLIDYLRKNTTIPILDLRPEMKKLVGQYRIYHRTDSHWNDVGAYPCYKMLLDVIGQWYPSVKPYPLADFEVSKRIAPGMNYAEMMATQEFLREEMIELKPKQPRLASKVDKGLLPSVAVPSQTFALRGPGQDLPRALMFHDSFMINLRPLLAEHLSWIAYYFQKEFDPAVVERERPNVVIQEMVEHNAVRYKPFNKFDFRGEEWLREQFDKSRQVAFTFNAGALGKPMQSNCKLQAAGTDVAIVAAKKDPIVFLPAFSWPAQPIIIKLDVSAPCATLSNFYYKSLARNEYCEANCVARNLTKGRNVIYITLPAGLTGLLRYDPGSHAGAYLLHGIEARVCEPGVDLSPYLIARKP